MKTLMLFAFEGVLYISACVAIANGKNLIAAITIGYLLVWAAVHRQLIKVNQKAIQKLLELQLDHDKKTLDAWRGALDEKK